MALDGLGTAKQTASAAGAAGAVDAVYPYGEEASAAGNEYLFTNQMRDPNGIDHFWMRSYVSTLGRWLTPDPAGAAAVDPNDPQTWNRYAYVGNGPSA